MPVHYFIFILSKHGQCVDVKSFTTKPFSVLYLGDQIFSSMSFTAVIVMLLPVLLKNNVINFVQSRKNPVMLLFDKFH